MQRGWIGIVALVMGCSYLNPDYLEGDTESVADTTATTATVGSTANYGSGDDDGPGTAGTTIEGDASDGGPDGPRVPGSCGADFYAVSEQGGLYVIDIEMQSIVLADDTVAASGAVATHPETGDIYISPSGNPGILEIVDPRDLLLREQQDVPGDTPPPPASRAGFDPEGKLWLGSTVGGDFISFTPGGMDRVPWSVDSLTSGGDVVMNNGGVGLVALANRTLVPVVFGNTGAPPIQIDGLPPDTTITGLAHEGPDILWALSANGLLIELGAEQLMPLGGVFALDIIELDSTTLNDMSPVRVQPDGCPP